MFTIYEVKGTLLIKFFASLISNEFCQKQTYLVSTAQC